jgi:uncharacterized membrane protein YqjE
MSIPAAQSADPSTAGPPPREPAGIKESVRDLLRSGLQYLQLRGALFGLEVADATGHLGRVVAAVGVILFAGVLAYLTGWAVLVVWAARCWAGGDLLPPLAVMTGVHVLAVAGALWWLTARARKRTLFPATRAEFAEDQKWLHRPNP